MRQPVNYDQVERRAGERALLEQLLDLHRKRGVDRVSGLAPEAAFGRILPATPLTIAGLVEHLALAEDEWFTMKMAGRKISGEPMLEQWPSPPRSILSEAAR